jgi:Aldo/keto reductase family
MTNEGRKAFLPEEQRAAPIISAVESVAEQAGRSMAQVALAWLRHQTVPVTPIIGARKVSQLQDNLASFDRELSAERLKSLDGASRIELGFPPEYLRERIGSCNYVWRGVGSTPALGLPVSGRILGGLGFHQEIPASTDRLDFTASPERHLTLRNKQQWAGCRIIFKWKHDSWVHARWRGLLLLWLFGRGNYD